MIKAYCPKPIEQLIAIKWEEKDYFKVSAAIDNVEYKSCYSIVIPPPNVTGLLHLGHGFQQTIMDILIRYQRMQGISVLWQVGTDHAGIATQLLVERELYSDYKSVTVYMRCCLIAESWKWVSKYISIIYNQMRRLGNSIDWARSRFTMDSDFCFAVKEAFIKLYENRLIYRDKYMVNWDPKLRTAISDLEVEARNVKSFMWYLRYPLEVGIVLDGLDYLVVTNPRPELIFGDACLVVNPKESRYRSLINKSVDLPLVKRRIPVISDNYVAMFKEAECMSITPAHDFSGFRIGKRHYLPMIEIFTKECFIRKKGLLFSWAKSSYFNSIYIPNVFHGLERFVARELVISELERLSLLDNKITYASLASYGDRSGIIIEPMVTNQWYVRTASLAKKAVDFVNKNLIKIIPKQYENMFFSWMSNIQDWCISRQLWWGHRIPVWYDNNGFSYVGHNEKEVRIIYSLKNSFTLKQESDVLDTWFSSALWTFSSLGWPNYNKELKAFHPTSIIISGFDIIFFWIARMIMFTIYFVKANNGKPQLPFKTVYITGLIKDEAGNKMSKSKGNTIDPIDLINGISLKELLIKRTNNMMHSKLYNEVTKATKKQFPFGIKAYGADVLRFALVSLVSNSRYMHWDMDRLEEYRSFCNKLWNASRFVLINVKDIHRHYEHLLMKQSLYLTDKWLFHMLNEAVKSFRIYIDNYRFDIAVSTLCFFVWNELCNWYLEFSKIAICSGNALKSKSTCFTLLVALELLLRLAHPIVPFITELIWVNIRSLLDKRTEDSIVIQTAPSYNNNFIAKSSFVSIEWVKKLITMIRTIRKELAIAWFNKAILLTRPISNDYYSVYKEVVSIYIYLANLNSISISSSIVKDKAPLSGSKIADGVWLMVI
ncbi:valine--tRNA ligase [Candidatus Tremblaya phenacola]|uniref:valine--tRNA ligase n=1 Tax=Candidatus Tremblayella phenacoccinincola TaxID=1010676 RepID=UPI001330299F|nr:valine--tRNA ligase [Candidatus Tremblaya phenacola]KAH0998195.1 Valyl-tRNA synthetase [Candidatus Tremblaya phenacola]